MLKSETIQTTPPPHPPKKEKKKKHPALPHVFLKQLLSEQLEVVQALPTSPIEEN